jgi:D-arabinose 1-dehydrogenase-like Zn-dependent alcohol dehydrogenase
VKAGRYVGRSNAPALEEVDRPEVKGPNDVIVRISGAGVCRTDLHILDGAAPLQPPPSPPFTLGHENAGWVEEVGSAVVTVRRGDPVILHPGVTCGLCSACRAGEDMYCPQIRIPGVDGSDGGYAEYLRTSIRSVVPLAPGTDPSGLAPLADAGVTAYHAIRRLQGSLDSGSVVLVLGIGGLGHLGIQLMRAMTSARVLAADNRPDRLDLAMSLGAESAHLTTDPEFVAGLRRASGGNGVDAVLDFVAEQDTPDLALRVLRRGGTYSIVGYGGTLTVPTVAMITQEHRILGNFVGTHKDLSELMDLQRRGGVSVTVQKYPLEKVAEAVEDLRRGRVVGRAVLVP